MKLLKILKFEFQNIFRSRWIFGYALGITCLTAGLAYLSSDSSKVVVSLALMTSILVPLVSLIFTVLHWYYNERFTVLLLTQPVSRRMVLLARYITLALSLSISVVFGVLVPLLFRLQWPSGLNLLLMNLVLLTFIFVGLATCIAAMISDRLIGTGVALGLWIYLALLHDGLLLVLLIVFRDSPMDLVAGMVSSLNPISLSRVIQMMQLDQALLLGHTGALTKQILISWKGLAWAGMAATLWLILPLILTHSRFKRKDL